MNMYVISDNVDTLTGLRLVGIIGKIIHSRDELWEELNRVLENPEIGVLLISEKLSGEFPDVIDEIRLKKSLPLVVEIPDRHGTKRPADFITSYLKDAIGVKL